MTFDIAPYQDILKENLPVPMELTWRQHIKFLSKDVPLSITETEFVYMRKYIEQNSLKAGFEIATGTGASALCAGLAMKKIGGKLVTLDAFIEEKYNDAGTYHGSKEVTLDAFGWQTVKYFIGRYGLADIVVPNMGWSPEDVPKVIEKTFGKEKLDYAFIDGDHQSIQIDFDAIVPFLGDRVAIFMHDVYDFPEDLTKHIESTIGGTLTVVVPATLGENLALVTRNLPPELIEDEDDKV